MSRVQEYKEPLAPESNMDYGRNWGKIGDERGWLNEGEIITSSEWSVTSPTEKPPAIVLERASISNDKQCTSVFLSNCTAGVVYTLSNMIMTVDLDGNMRQEIKSGIVRCCRK